MSKLVAILDKSTGLVSKSQPRAIPRHTTAVVEVQLESRQGGIPLETFQEMRDLGRFLLRAHGQTIAAGIVKEILE